MQRGGRHQRGRRSAAQQGVHARERDPGLPVVGQELAEPVGEVGDEAQVGDEQDEVAHRQAAVAQAAGGQQHDQARADAHRVGRDGVQRLRRQAIGQHGGAALLVQPPEVGHGPLFGAGGLHRLHRRQDIADRAGDLAGGLAAGRAVAAQRGAGPPRRPTATSTSGRMATRVMRALICSRTRNATTANRPWTENLVGPIQVVLGLVGIVAKAADRLADGEGQRIGARPVQDVPQQVAAQQPAHREPQMISTKPAMSQRAARPTAITTSSTISPVVPTGQVRLPGERIEEGAGDQPRQQRRQVHHAPQRRVEQVEPGRVAGHFHQVAPGRRAAS